MAPNVAPACGNQTPIGAVAPSSTISMSTGWSSPRIGAACQARRCSTCANTSGRKWVRTWGRPLPSSTEPKTKSTYTSSTPEGGALPPGQPPPGASHRGGCDRASLAGLTGLRRAAGSGPRRTSPDRVVARRSVSSRTTHQPETTRTGRASSRPEGRCFHPRSPMNSALSPRCFYDSPPALPEVPAVGSSRRYFFAASSGTDASSSPRLASICSARTTTDGPSMWK